MRQRLKLQGEYQFLVGTYKNIFGCCCKNRLKRDDDDQQKDYLFVLTPIISNDEDADHDD